MPALATATSRPPSRSARSSIGGGQRDRVAHVGDRGLGARQAGGDRLEPRAVDVDQRQPHAARGQLARELGADARRRAGDQRRRARRGSRSSEWNPSPLRSATVPPMSGPPGDEAAADSNPVAAAAGQPQQPQWQQQQPQWGSSSRNGGSGGRPAAVRRADHAGLGDRRADPRDLRARRCCFCSSGCSCAVAGARHRHTRRATRSTPRAAASAAAGWRLAGHRASAGSGSPGPSLFIILVIVGAASTPVLGRRHDRRALGERVGPARAAEQRDRRRPRAAACA